MTIVCLDTQILSFGLIKIPPAGNEYLVPLAADFLKWVEQKKFTVILPTVVVSELLIAVAPERHTEVLKLFRRDWRIAEFDLASARQNSLMRRHHIIKYKLNHLLDPNKPGATKDALKADVMIIATAITYGADLLYSHDKTLLNLAEDFIEAKNFEHEEFQLQIRWQESDEHEQ